MVSESRERERERELNSTSKRGSRSSSRVHNRGERILLSGGCDRQAKLVRLGDIADVRFGIKTGANEFFYVEDATDKEDMKFEEIKPKIKNLGKLKSLKEIKKAGLRVVRNTKTEDYWLIEEDFLKPILRRPRECESILLNPDTFSYKVLLCGLGHADLKKTYVGEYIKFGDSKGVSRNPTCSSRSPWYSIGTQQEAFICSKMTTKYRHYFPTSPKPFLVDARFYSIYPRRGIDVEKLAASLNSMFSALGLELLGRTYGGGGGPLDIKVYETKELLTIRPDLLAKDVSLWGTRLAMRPVLHVWKEIECADRREFDTKMFATLGLSAKEIDEVYGEVVKLVQNRLQKARSV